MVGRTGEVVGATVVVVEAAVVVVVEAAVDAVLLPDASVVVVVTGTVLGMPVPGAGLGVVVAFLMRRLDVVLTKGPVVAVIDVGLVAELVVVVVMASDALPQMFASKA